MELNEKYSLKKELRHGNSSKFGRTFSGISKFTGEPVILKFVVKNNDVSTGAKQLKNESLFNFQFEGLPTIIDYFESDNECILVRNFQTGEILSTYWKTLSRMERIPFLIEFLKELNVLFKELSKHSVVHCDLKPSNILVRKNETGKINVSLIDFGLSIKTTKNIDRKIIFPLGFAAPELLLNQLGLVDHRTDQFALGITIWYLLTEQLPLTHPNPSIYTNLQLTHPLTDHSLLPKGMYPILKRMSNKYSFKTAPNLMTAQELITCLKQGIEMRYPSLDDVISEFENIVSTRKKWFKF
jgi:serine/threonine protein kinase